jgi:regulator of protease activity HflC (stomatin/prohibitin superfamily)
MYIFLLLVGVIPLVSLPFIAKYKSKLPLPNYLNKIILGGGGLLVFLGLFNGAFFYAEPGFQYHVRTIWGEERLVTKVGFSLYGFGRYNAWKNAITVQAIPDVKSENLSNAENDVGQSSATLPPLNIMFLDQVDADTYATARFRLPVDKNSFLSLVHDYRTPENFLRTALVPAFKETLQSTGSLMSAEEYYSGGRTEFNTEFENQMRDGIYIVKRIQKQVKDSTVSTKASANASKMTKQDNYGNEVKTIFVVEKQYKKDGTLIRKTQKFTDYGVVLVEARVTDMKPNQKFVERMQLKQKASADRAIAREQRIQEEEQKLLAIAKGEREVAERQAKAKVEQIQKTTDAETEKQLVLTNAQKLKEEAEIAKQTAAINLEKAKLEAKTIKTLADAEAHKKRSIMQADNALAQKLEAEIEIQKVWADAYAKRQVPQYVFGGSGNVPSGSDSETSNFMKIMTLDAAERLNYNREVQKPRSNSASKK